MRNLFNNEPRPVAVYDVDDKKLVLLFCSTRKANLYIFENNIWNKAKLYDTKKLKNSKNRFKRTICFRTATSNQLKLLGDFDYLILDIRFKKPPKIKLSCEFTCLAASPNVRNK